jgi:hypothetical protein
MLLKSKSEKLMKVRKQPGACAQEIADQKDILRIFTNFYGIAQKSVKTEQLVNINFFENLMLLKSKSAKLMKVWK